MEVPPYFPMAELSFTNVKNSIYLPLPTGRGNIEALFSQYSEGDIVFLLSAVGHILWGLATRLSDLIPGRWATFGNSP